MRLRAFLVPVFLATLVTGCAGDAPIPSPVTETGSLRGRIEQGIYHDSRGWFEVATPFKEGDAEFRYMQVHEEYEANLSFVNFIPITNPGEDYVVYSEDVAAVNRPVPDMDQLADSAVRFFGKQLTDERAEPMVLVQHEAWQTPRTRGIIRFYTEKAPSSHLMIDAGQAGASLMPALAEDYTAYIVMYVTSRAGRIAVVWTEWPHDCKVCAPTPAVSDAPATDDPIAALLAGNARAAAFIASLRLTPAIGDGGG